MVSREPPVRDFCIPGPNEVLYDIIIVGAGPCGLSIAARLCERNAAAIFTDEEHQRLHRMKRHGNKIPLRQGASSANVIRPEYNMIVLDADHDNWMGRWNRLFKTFDIRQLRSPLFWHVDPNDRDSLLSKAYAQRREKELVEIHGCVGKEINKRSKKGGRYIGSKEDSRVLINERDRKDYFNPTQALFRDHCSDVICRYSLQAGRLVCKEQVLDIAFSSVPEVSAADEKLFTVRTGAGIRYSRAVILAVGPGNQPRIPGIPGQMSSVSTNGLREHPQACHAMQIREFPDKTVKCRMEAGQHTNILIVGGGLTSAQLADLAIRKGVGTVWHMMRGPLRVKTFDLDLSWMGKFRNAEQSRFWQASSDEERLNIIQEARGGGSVTPPYFRILQQHVACDKLRVLNTPT